MTDPFNPRRMFMGAAKKYFLDALETSDDARRPPAVDEAPRLTPRAIERTRMSRSRDRILANLDDMYREAFERAKATGDESQMASLDFAYRREQLYFEILLDVRDAMERR
ncbi:MAG: hypothetical protein IT359_21405 [Gemmatimonadaceae bacterium]|nr:hypothetical protein [Gemmatimonadaceae bacterium]